MAEEEAKGITASEERELRRVFDFLCNYQQKAKIERRLNPLLDKRSKIQAHRKSPEAVRMVDEDGEIMSEEAINAEFDQLTEQIEALQAQIAEYDQNPRKKIRAADLNEALKNLGKRCTKKEIEDMIWEVDENLDGCVDWDEFQLMFQRNITDKTGLEPFQLFNVVQFMMYDKDNSGSVTVDETMHMLFARYGKDRLESQMKALFGEDLKTADGDGQLSFLEYLKAVSIRLPKKRKKAGSRAV